MSDDTVLEWIMNRAHLVEHTGFCMGSFEVSCLDECPMYEDCIKLYIEERSKKL